VSLLLLYRPTLDEAVFDADGFLPKPKKRKARTKKLEATPKIKALGQIEEIAKRQGELVIEIRKRKEKWEEDELFLFMYLDD
jgi:hypothetical protein